MGTFVDLTFGGGGHTVALAKLSPDYCLYATDQDPEALQNGYKRIESEGLKERVTLLDMNFESFYSYCIENNICDLDGILIDLGVSSHHFDSAQRGFSFRFDAPLDMRMDVDNDSVETAAELLNRLSEEEIADILWKYGEERFSRQIARNIVASRNDEPITTTKQLENIIFHSYPKKMRFGRLHPATKSFQALRIAVNRELEVLQKVLEDLPQLLKVGGRMAIITFHSLEDRIVKRSYNFLAKEKKTVKILHKKPIVPSKKELEENKRSRSAKLRVIEKV
jgi:16S rRNA (cytosine1402-N4)-methyltransferase